MDAQLDVSFQGVRSRLPVSVRESTHPQRARGRLAVWTDALIHARFYDPSAPPITVPAARPVMVDVTNARVVVRTYQGPAAYEHDIPYMTAAGFVPQSQSSSRGRLNVPATVGKALLFLPWAILRPSRQPDPIVVTWVRG